MAQPNEINEIEEIYIAQEDRYHRQGLIPWWDQERVRQAKILVVGAGALGNEILKTLTLTGVGQLLIYDMDVIEASNLSRSILFRAADEGRLKAEVAAERIQTLNPDVLAVGYGADIIAQAGLGVFLWADIVICGLDNRIARMFVNRACAWTGRIWVDGAIEALDGTVRVFDPIHTACYECTMNETDHRLVRERMSCARLARDIVAQGHMPTTAVTAGVVGSLQAQEALKVLHGQPTLMGEGIHLHGTWTDFSRVSYPRREDCPGHDNCGPLIPLGYGVADLTLGQLLDRAEQAVGPGAVLDLSREVIIRLACSSCGQSELCGKVLGAVREAEARCPTCGAHRAPLFTASISRDDDFDLTLTPAEIGVPPFDSLIARSGLDRRQAWLFDGDMPAVLGPLADKHIFETTS